VALSFSRHAKQYTVLPITSTLCLTFLEGSGLSTVSECSVVDILPYRLGRNDVAKGKGVVSSSYEFQI